MKHLNVFFGKRTDLLTLLCNFTISFYIRSLIRRVQTKSPSSKKPGWICSWNTNSMALLTMLFFMWCFTCGQSKSSGGTGGTRTLVLSEEPRIELHKGFLSSAEITAIRKLAEEEMFKDTCGLFFVFSFLTKWYLLVAAILLESCEGLWNTGHDGVVGCLQPPFLTSTPMVKSRRTWRILKLEAALRRKWLEVKRFPPWTSQTLTLTPKMLWSGMSCKMSLTEVRKCLALYSLQSFFFCFL